jgi:voltage-gated potassium channel
MRIQSWLGLAGVDKSENIRAKRIANYFNMIGVLIALWIIIIWYQEASHTVSKDDLRFHNITVWIFFLLELFVITSFVTKKIHYVKNNWLNLFIIIAGVPLLLDVDLHAINLGSLRLLLVVNLLISVSDTLRTFLTRNQLGATLLITTVFTMMAGLILHGVDANIKSAADGIWWAWVTLTSVGYGDVVPTSLLGRLIGVIVMVVGMAFSALLTASILSLLLSEQEGKMIRYTKQELIEQLKMEQRLERLETKLDHLLTRLNDVR